MHMVLPWGVNILGGVEKKKVYTLNFSIIGGVGTPTERDCTE